MIGDEVTDVEGSRDAPIWWNGDIVSVGIDFLTDSKRTGSTRMELVAFSAA